MSVFFNRLQATSGQGLCHIHLCTSSTYWNGWHLIDILEMFTKINNDLRTSWWDKEKSNTKQEYGHFSKSWTGLSRAQTTPVASMSLSGMRRQNGTCFISPFIAERSKPRSDLTQKKTMLGLTVWGNEGVGLNFEAKGSGWMWTWHSLWLLPSLSSLSGSGGGADDTIIVTLRHISLRYRRI